MNERAVILAERSGRMRGRIAALLDFFGIHPDELATCEIFDAPPDGKIRVIASSDEFAAVVRRLQAAPGLRDSWRERVHSAFVFRSGGSESMSEIAAALGGRGPVPLRPADGVDWMVADAFPEYCGPMSGVAIRSRPGAADEILPFGGSDRSATNLIVNDEGSALSKIDWHSVPVFLSTSREIVDIDAELGTANFDVRDRPLSAVPLVLYMKWAFPDTGRRAPEINGCVVLDDPLLKPRYGFVRFEELLNVMVRHDFSTNVAFIPWNWNRSDGNVARMFRENLDRYSLSIHGCDHTGGEFGTPDAGLLVQKTKRAVDRMSRHMARTGVRHDRIMVFPQGVFSAPAMEVLQRFDFVAAVNTEIGGVGPGLPTVRIRDAWDVAIMAYSGFPLFSRRYPGHGIENFAFDMMLGKPCLVVIHHDFCRDKYAALVDFIDRLNALNCPLSWRGLGEVARRSFLRRGASSGITDVDMFANELRLENVSAGRKRFRVTRRACDPAAVETVRLGASQVSWGDSSQGLVFEAELEPGEVGTVTVSFRQLPADRVVPSGARYELKTMARRYLSEIRDNYVATSKALSRVMALVR